MMNQEVFFLKLGKFDRKNIIDKKLAELNKDGWRVTSLTYVDNEYIILAEKEPPPPLFFTLPSDVSPYEVEQMQKTLLEQYENGALREHKPFIISGDVEVTRVDERPSQRIEITREMMDSWFGPSDELLEAKKVMEDVQDRLSKGKITINDARRELGIFEEGVDNLI